MTAKVLARIRRVAAAIPGPVLTGRMMTQGIAMNSQSSRSIPELFGDAVGQLAKLVGNEFDLARAVRKGKPGGRAAAMIGAGAIVLIPALVLLLFGVSAVLIRSGLSDPVAYSLTGAGAALVSLALIATGLSRVSGDNLKPSVTLDQVQRDKVAAKEMVR
jgi:hypothetical protein